MRVQPNDNEVFLDGCNCIDLYLFLIFFCYQKLLALIHEIVQSHDNSSNCSQPTEPCCADTRGVDFNVLSNCDHMILFNLIYK